MEMLSLQMQKTDLDIQGLRFDLAVLVAACRESDENLTVVYTQIHSLGPMTSW